VLPSYTVNCNATHFENVLFCIFFLHPYCATTQGLLITQASRSHLYTPQSIGLLWTSDQLRRRDLYLTTHSTHESEKPTPPVGFEPTISADERPQTHALVRAANRTSAYSPYCNKLQTNCLDPNKIQVVRMSPTGSLLQSQTFRILINLLAPEIF
jgi:hypothetical protein